ncbi:hypothetical protein GGTG_12278 [Gaeumannomyces tritici R3-111a-1]|uniref:Uncharacterized protein n=1 Tax=Gaeumannomyces tritici (strain R3-111a-1) TaxID=644352 RepID=J3PFK3_GAET3|nr:hypothetical protein GGTG_12278 [Gaeumannomyces tritici R3-111a-1]EJT70105.1 hypothetical protein GGTG_12278 [Gaeumannomyces tritici R3-111a-1]
MFTDFSIDDQGQEGAGALASSPRRHPQPRHWPGVDDTPSVRRRRSLGIHPAPGSSIGMDADLATRLGEWLTTIWA